MKEKIKKEKSKVRKIVEWCLTIVLLGIFAAIAIGQILGLTSRSKNNDQTLNFGVYGNFLVLTDSMEPEYEINTAIVTKKENLSSLYKLYLEYQEDNKAIEEEYSTKINAAASSEEKITLISEMEKKEKHIDITFSDTYTSYSSIKPSKNTTSPILNMLNEPVQANSVMTHRLREMRVDESKNEGEGKYIFITSGTNIGGHYSQFGQYQAFTENEYLGTVKINSPFLGGFFKFVSSVWGLLILLLIPALYLVITAVLDIVKALKNKEDDDDNDDNNNNSNSSSLDGLSDEDKERLKQEMLQEMLNNKE